MSVTNTDTKTDLIINSMSREVYDYLKQTSSIVEDQLYLIDEDNLNAENQQIVNVANPILSSDAANKAYVDEAVKDVDLTQYYKKSETSSATELKAAFNDKSDKSTTLAGYGITDAKIDNGTITLGSATIAPLTAIPSDYKTYITTLSTLSSDGYVMTTLLNTISTMLSTSIQNKVKLKTWDDDDPV